MARNFTGTDKVAHGSPTALDDAATITLLAWVYPTSLAGSTFAGTGSKGVNLFFNHDNSGGFGGAGSMRVRIVHATTNLDYFTATDVVKVNVWNFLAFCVDTGAAAGSKVKFYRGTVNTPAVENASVTATDPSGARTSDAASNWETGNIIDAFPAIAYIGPIMVLNSTLTLAGVIRQQFRMRNEATTQIFSPYYGASTEPDFSGKGNNGTVTGTTIVPPPPIYPLFG